MLQAINLTKSYGNHTALSDLNLTVAPGEVFCLLGANGAGKSTTINLFMGFIQPSSGTVKINDLDVSSQSLQTKKYVTYIPENLNLYPSLSGVENLLFFTSLSGFNLSKSEGQNLLDSVGLQTDAHNKRVNKYSKGMRQKVGIAIAKAKQADNLLLDEPTSGLDPKASNEFAQLLHDMQQNNVAILMATHDLFRAKESGTHIGIMRDGVLQNVVASKNISLQQLEELYLDTMNYKNLQTSL